MSKHEKDSIEKAAEFGVAAMVSAKRAAIFAPIATVVPKAPVAYAVSRPALALSSAPQSRANAQPIRVVARPSSRPLSTVNPAIIDIPRPRDIPQGVSMGPSAPSAPAADTATVSSGGGGGGGGSADAFFPPDEQQYAPYDGGLAPDEPQGSIEVAKPLTSTALMLRPATVPPPAVKPSLWQRFIALFGFGKKSATMGGESMQTMIPNVVNRARSGDQNAMALIAMVRDNAKKGHPKAQESFALLSEYVRTHPVSNPRIGVDPQLGHERGVYADAVALSHGPTLTNPRIGETLSHFGGEERDAIAFGIEHKEAASERSRNPRVSRAIRMGKILGHARRLQAVRMAGSKLGKFDAKVGWELDDE